MSRCCHIYKCAHTIMHGVADGSARLVNNNNKTRVSSGNVLTLEQKQKKSSSEQRARRGFDHIDMLDVSNEQLGIPNFKYSFWSE